MFVVHARPVTTLVQPDYRRVRRVAKVPSLSRAQHRPALRVLLVQVSRRRVRPTALFVTSVATQTQLAKLPALLVLRHTISQQRIKQLALPAHLVNMDRSPALSRAAIVHLRAISAPEQQRHHSQYRMASSQLAVQAMELEIMTLHHVQLVTHARAVSRISVLQANLATRLV